MKLSDYLDAYYEFSEKTSTVTRQLTFAGIAVVWIFKSGEGSNIQLPQQLIYSLLFFVICLGFDLLQYVVGTLIWYFFYQYHEKRLKSKKDDPYLLASPWYSKIISLFFWVKLVAVFVAHVYLAAYFVKLMKIF